MAKKEAKKDAKDNKKDDKKGKGKGKKVNVNDKKIASSNSSEIFI